MVGMIMETDFSSSEKGGGRFKPVLCMNYTIYSNVQFIFSTPDTRAAGLEETDQQPLPGEQGINLDNSGPKLPEFSNRPPGDIMLKIICLSSFIQHYKTSFQGNNSISFCLLC